MNWSFSIDPGDLAFDIDGVVADTMKVFLDLAGKHYGLTWLTKEDLRAYDLYSCLDLDRRIIDELICLTLDDEHTLQIPPVDGCVAVLTRLAESAPLHFVTARIWPESIIRWLHQTLPHVEPSRIRVFATGDPEAKFHILQELRVRFFVEDRLETCQHLQERGIQPLLFDQPWNRAAGSEDIPRFAHWAQLSQWLV